MELTLIVEKKKNKDGKEFNSYYALVDGVVIYFKPSNYQLANYILSQLENKNNKK